MKVYDGRRFVPLQAVLNRPDILSLIETFDLEFLGRSLPNRWIVSPASQERFRQIVSEVNSCSQKIENPRTFAEVFSERNHRRKNFKNVYKSNNDYTQLSIDWR